MKKERHKGKVISVNRSDTTGVKKINVFRANLLPSWGIEGDAHGGSWHRQVSLLAIESIEKMRAMGLNVMPGEFAENITTMGIDLMNIPVGKHIRIGEEVVLEVTQIGKECHKGCSILQEVGDCIMPREGIFARVIKGGEIAVEDAIIVEE
jgi:MOSC domain-containing protein YiiM